MTAIRNQKGLVMPLVMIFLVLSQLVYLGMQHVCQTQLQHLQLLQNRYQSDAQATLTKRFISNGEPEITATWTQQTQSEINQIYDRLIQELQPTQILYEDDLRQWGLWQINKDGQTSICLYSMSILIDAVSFPNDSLPYQVRLTNTKHITTGAYKDQLLHRVDARLVDFIRQIEHDNWRYINQTDQLLAYHVKESLKDVKQINFNSGIIYLQHQPNEIHLQSVLNHPDYQFDHLIQRVQLPTFLHVTTLFYTPS